MRYSLGTHTEQSILDTLELIIMAKDAPRAHRIAYLLKANSKLEIVRLKFRLYLDLKLTNETKIFQIQADIAEIGRMLGGWIKASKNR